MIIRPIAAISLMLLLAASAHAQDAKAPEESTLALGASYYARLVERRLAKEAA